MSALEAAMRLQEEAIQAVALAASQLSTGAEGIRAKRGAPYDNGFTVQASHMFDLRQALANWDKANEAVIKAVRENPETLKTAPLDEDDTSTDDGDEE